MELLLALLGLSLFAYLIIEGFREAVRDGTVVIEDTGRFAEPVINPDGTPPVDTGYWRRKYMNEHPEIFAKWKE